MLGRTPRQTHMGNKHTKTYGEKKSQLNTTNYYHTKWLWNQSGYIYLKQIDIARLIKLSVDVNILQFPEVHMYQDCKKLILKVHESCKRI